MPFDGGTISVGAATSAFTAVLRLSQGVYEIIAVGEQVRNLLDTTKAINETMKGVQMLRSRKAHLLLDFEKTYIDEQIDFTEKALKDVAALIEAQRVDMQVKTKPGDEVLKTRHIKIHHRAKFVFRDSPKVGTNLVKLGIATQGLHQAMTYLMAKEGHPDALTVPESGKAGFGRSGSSPTRKAPPDYELSQFIHRRKTLSGTQRKEAGHKAKARFVAEQEESQSADRSRTWADDQSLRSSGSWCGATERLDLHSDLDKDESPFFDETPACVPISSIYDGIDEGSHLNPVRRMDASAHPPLFPRHSEPVVTAVSEEQPPRPPPKPAAYQTSQIMRPGRGPSQDDYKSQAQSARSNDPRLKPFPTPQRKPKPMASATSLNSAASDQYEETTIPRNYSRGRAYLEYLVNEADSGQETPVTRTRSLQTRDTPQYSDYERDFARETPGAYGWRN